jgi:aspartate/glutamate racemase
MSDVPTSTPRIGLIHATTLSMDPTKHAFARHWPEAQFFHVLDNSLSDDRNKDFDLSEDLTRRITSLADYTMSCGVDGLLFTCSAFGSAIEAVAGRASVPVLKPNEAMFEHALEIGGPVAMLATFQPSISSMEKELQLMAKEQGVQMDMQSICVPEARTALNAGDVDTHNGLLADAAQKLMGINAILLAHFSMDRAVDEIESRTKIPVLSPPADAVVHFKSKLN